MIQRHAPAKLNLFLHVIGRRGDGYHLLESLFAFTRTGDLITIEESDQLSLTIEGPFAAELEGFNPKENLVYLAANKLAEACGGTRGASIVLKKKLPIAAGIGGGSADAAATLLALNDLWGLNKPVEDLEALALKLGADVPACLYQQPLLVRGIGEDITPVSLENEWHVLLVNPLKPVSTPEIFAAFKDGGQPFHRDGLCLPDPVALSWIADETTNSLAGPAQGLCPAINEVLSIIGAQPGVRLARMSGSGATCFAFFDTAAAAAAAREAVMKKRPEWWTMQDQLIAG